MLKAKPQQITLLHDNVESLVHSEDQRITDLEYQLDDDILGEELKRTSDIDRDIERDADPEDVMEDNHESVGDEDSLVEVEEGQSHLHYNDNDEETPASGPVMKNTEGENVTISSTFVEIGSTVSLPGETEVTGNLENREIPEDPSNDDENNVQQPTRHVTNNDSLDTKPTSVSVEALQYRLKFHTGNSIVLFPVPGLDAEQPPMFNDDELARRAIEELISTLRTSYSQVFREQDEIVIDFPALELSISEDNVYAAQLSLADIGDIYSRIYRRDVGSRSAVQLEMELVARTQTRFIARYNQLSLELSPEGNTPEDFDRERTTATADIDTQEDKGESPRNLLNEIELEDASQQEMQPVEELNEANTEKSYLPDEQDEPFTAEEQVQSNVILAEDEDFDKAYDFEVLESGKQTTEEVENAEVVVEETAEDEEAMLERIKETARPLDIAGELTIKEDMRVAERSESTESEVMQDDVEGITADNEDTEGTDAVDTKYSKGEEVLSYEEAFEAEVTYEEIPNAAPGTENSVRVDPEGKRSLEDDDADEKISNRTSPRKRRLVGRSIQRQ